MVTTLKQGATSEYIQKLLKKLSKDIRKKGVDTMKYCGKIKLKEDALTIQKSLRNEW